MNLPLSQQELLVHPHLGLGDSLVLNAAVRHLAGTYSTVTILCKPHNSPTESFMWRDLINVEVFSVKDDDEAKGAMEAARAAGFPTLGFGLWGPQPFDLDHWDRDFYRQINLDPQLRWNGFKVFRQPSRELPVPDKPFILLHDDEDRGYKINRSLIRDDLTIVSVTPSTPNLFDYWGLMENATELHFIDSSPAILVDSLPLVRGQRFMHSYARQGRPPTYQTPWQEVVNVSSTPSLEATNG